MFCFEVLNVILCFSMFVLLVVCVFLCLFLMFYIFLCVFYVFLCLLFYVFSCVLCVYLAHRIGFFKQASGLHIITRLPRYWAWLLVEMVKSSIDVAKIVLNPKLPISPSIIDIQAQPKGKIGQAILGNAITLSPGTMTIDVYDGNLKIHCLTRDTEKSLLNGDANQRTSDLTTS